MAVFNKKEDLELIRESGRKLSKILMEVKKKVKVGVSTLELDEFAQELIKKDSIIDLLKQNYETEKVEKIKKYEALRARGDAILYDFKPYIYLIKAIDEFSYCGASSEIKKILDKQTKGTSYTKAVYRARSQEFNKIKC